MSDDSSRNLVAESSQIIYDGFIRYNIYFHRITLRARIRFEKRDWKGHQQDIVARVELYERSVRRIVRILRRELGNKVDNHELWNDIRSYFGQRLEKVPDSGFIKTFFNSITRRIFNTLGTDQKLEFVSVGFEDDIEQAKALSLRHYPHWHSVEKIFETILEDFSFRIPYENLMNDAKLIAERIELINLSQEDRKKEFLRFEFIESIFYQSARAYMVGRIISKQDVSPIVIALKNTNKGIKVDAVLMTQAEVSIVFGYTRSYYFAEPNSVVGAVHFLKSIIPEKPIDELYTVLGRLRQGKTERHRIFTEHLKMTNDKFIHAAGEKGLVMIVFTLPSYDLVFKVMRDKFGYPKAITHSEVVHKYKLVSKHDRAGRLIDTQEFKNLALPISRFSENLLEELTNESAKNVYIEGDKLFFGHVYIERRVRPLNLYINEVSQKDAELAILDYGQSIKDLAQTNIFPGDLLLKNFGVTRHNRVIFYDYDEVSLVSECNFRSIPQARDDIEEMRINSWYYVSDYDIFPEEFIKFLSMKQDLCSLFLKVHGDLMTADYWNTIKTRQLAGEASIVIPYFRPGLPEEKSSDITIL